MQNKVYYNQEVKQKFIDAMSNKSYSKAYERVFRYAKQYEEFNNKDLYSFNQSELLTFFKGISHGKKYTTIYTYNSLLADYKTWAKENGMANVVEGICPANLLKTISKFEEYLILNDSDIDDLTQYAVIDGADYNCVIVIRLLWETKGMADIEDIVKIKLEDLNVENETVVIGGIEYEISGWLTSLIEDFANMSYLIFKNKRGSYRILTAKENSGYILRTALTKTKIQNNKIGEALTPSYISNLMYQFSERNIGERLTINDIKMSLALRYMLENRKTHAEMYSDKRYFNNLPSRVYAFVFENNAKDKFPILYSQYVRYFHNMKNLNQ